MPQEYREPELGSDIPPVGDSVDPNAAPAAAAEPGTGGKKRRGRPPGSGRTAGSTAKSGQKVALDLSSLTGMFVGAHVLFAHQTGTPEMMMGEDEGKQFMQAAQNVMRHYSVQSTQKTLDWIAFAGVSMMLYAPRFVAIRIRKQGERAAKNNPGNVMQFKRDEQGNPGFAPSVVQPDMSDEAI